VLPASIIKAVDSTLMMETAGACKTLVNFYRITQHRNPEDSHFHTCCYENLKSQNNNVRYARAKRNIYVDVYQWSESLKKEQF
jgi:hypothetical protein